MGVGPTFSNSEVSGPSVYSNQTPYSFKGLHSRGMYMYIFIYVCIYTHVYGKYFYVYMCVCMYM